MLLDLSKFYIPNKIIKKVNIKAFWLYFLKIIFQEFKDEDIARIFILFSSLILISTFFIDNYYYQKKDLKSDFFYHYIQIIFKVKYSIRKRDNISFNKYCSNPLSKVQKSSTTLEYKILIALIRPLSTNKNIEDIIKRDNSKTNIR